MHSSGHVDWFAVTYPNRTNVLSLLPTKLTRFPLMERGMPPHGYMQRLENEMGVTIFRKGSNEQGQHLIMTGQVMAAYHTLGGTDLELCAVAIAGNAKASRLDVAVDVWDGSILIDDLVQAVKDQEVKTRARAGKHIEHVIDQGEGLYIGSKASNRLFRAYNKAYEQHTDENWIRLELQLKKQHAQAVLHTLAKEQDTRDVINVAITSFVDFPTNPGYLEATAERTVNIPKVPRKMTSTERWLLDICAPALAKFDLSHPDQDILDAFLTAYGVAKQELQSADTR